jgi:hypothetical protein
MLFPVTKLRHTITLHRLRDTTARDTHGNEIRAQDGDDVDVPARVIPRASLERLDSRDVLEGTYLVIVAADTDVTGVDVFDWNGQRFRIDGPPRILDAGIPHLELDATVISGA